MDAPSSDRQGLRLAVVERGAGGGKLRGPSADPIPLPTSRASTSAKITFCELGEAFHIPVQSVWRAERWSFDLPAI